MDYPTLSIICFVGAGICALGLVIDAAWDKYKQTKVTS